MDRIITILKLGLAAVCWSMGHTEIDPEKLDPLKAKLHPTEPALSPTQAAMAFSMFAGRPR